jgi:hypothetical protein
MTSRALSETLSQRFGASIAHTVLAALGIDQVDRPVELLLIQQSIDMALDAELVVAGAHFMAQLPISALANSPGFQRAALQAGVPADRLDAEQRLRIDAAFARRWRADGRLGTPASDIERAQATMASVLLEVLP